MEWSSENINKGKALLSDITENMKGLISQVDTLQEAVNNKTYITENGLNLLELKNQSFLSYLSSLSFVSLMKLCGKKLDGHSNVDRLVELRVLMERLRPLEHKHRYQIDKMIKIATQEAPVEKQQVRATFESSEESEEETSKEDVKKLKKGIADKNLYEAPKIQSMKYSDDEQENTKEKERQRKRFLNSSMMQDNLSEFNEEPETVHNTDPFKKKGMKKMRRIQEYEENNFTRLPSSKKEQKSLQQITTAGNMRDELLGFRSFVEADKKRKRKPNSGKKKSSKKRRKH